MQFNKKKNRSIMKKTHSLTPIISALVMTGSAIAGCADKKENTFEVDVMTFNIRTSPAHDSKDICDIIRNISPDVIGLQEATRSRIDGIRKILPEYGEIGEGRDGGEKSEYSAILYRFDRFKVDESGTFWLSDTPDKPSITWGNSCIRICTWARFIEKKSGQAFYMYNTHLDHRSQPSREKSVRMIASHIQKRAHQNPFVLTGDFNVGENNTAVKYLKGTGDIAIPAPISIVDTFRVLHPDEKVVGTFNNFKGHSKGPKIDYVFTNPNPNTCVLNASIIRTHNGEGIFPSDHYPVTANLRFGSESKTISKSK